MRLLYFVPALALEKLDAVAALRRAWALTRGAFWRTLGYYVVAAVLVAIPSYAVSFISQFFAFPVSNTSSLPEVGGNAVTLVAPQDPAAWLAAIRRLAAPGGARDEMIERGRDRANRYRWTASAAGYAGLMGALS